MSIRTETDPTFLIEGGGASEDAALIGKPPEYRWFDDGSFRHLVTPFSVLRHSKNVHSQRGDDGIIEHIFTTMRQQKRFFVEFGGWDGKHLAQCRALFERGWDGAFIEANPDKFEELKYNYRHAPNIICINEMVSAGHGTEGRDLDSIAAEHFPGRHVDFLSIDIDGWDDRVFQHMRMFPTCVCVEGGFSWHPLFTQRVPDEIAKLNLQQPLSVFIQIGREKGYEPICFNQNTFFLLRNLADKFFPHTPRDVYTLWKDAWFNESEAFRKAVGNDRRTNPLIREIEGPNYYLLPWERVEN